MTQASRPHQAQQVRFGDPEDQPQRQEATTVSDFLLDIATEIGMSPDKIRVRRDTSDLLSNLKKGVIINLTIKFPRFSVRVTPESLGLYSVNSQVDQVINDYFRLGRQSVLPPKYQAMLDTAEKNARYNLRRFGYKTHWGRFIPTTYFKAWQKEDERFHNEFEECKLTILREYDEICEQVLSDYRQFAEEAWKRYVFATSLAGAREDQAVTAVLNQVAAILHAEAGKEAFVENYLDIIRRGIPTPFQVSEGFSYDAEPSIIPLPSLLAKDVEAAGRIYDENAIKDAELKAEYARLQEEERLAYQLGQQERALEAEKQRLRIRHEQDLAAQQLEMEQAVLRSAQRQKENLIAEFYSDVVGEMNRHIVDITDRVLKAIAKNGSVGGSGSAALFNLVEEMRKMNFIGSMTIEEQIARLDAVLPSKSERIAAKKGGQKLDVNRIQAVVQAIHDEADKVALELNTMPRSRRAHSGDEIAIVTPTVDLDRVGRTNRALEGDFTPGTGPDAIDRKVVRSRRAL